MFKEDYARLEVLVGEHLPDDLAERRLTLLYTRGLLMWGGVVQLGSILIRPTDLWPDGDPFGRWKVTDV